MNVRWIRFASVPALLLAGCGAPQPDKFADGTVTTRLHPEAAAVVRTSTVEHFGSPQSLVATLALAGKEPYAIHFGRIEGEVLPPGKNQSLKDYQIRVSLSGDQSVKPDDLKGLGLVWQSGAYTSAVYEAPKSDPKNKVKKGDELVADFVVLRFQPSETPGEGVLSLNFKLESPPKAGDRFVLIGHQLRAGRSLYMRYCMHCHGASGDGNGPTAKYLNPKPRDYRLGKFKFTSTVPPDAKPTRDDLLRIVKQGIPGTYMPSFLMVNEAELKSIVEYVRWLSMRGEYELSLGKELGALELSRTGWRNLEKSGEQAYQEDLKLYQSGKVKQEPKPENYGPKRELQTFVNGLGEKSSTTIDFLRTSWENAEKPSFQLTPKIKRPTPASPDYEQSIARGRALFLGNKAKCSECHGTTGRGNGPQTTAFQKNTQPLAEAPLYPDPGLHDDWGNPIKPRNLTTGIFRGGRRPIDIYHRIRGGIKGTPMPPGALTDPEIWDLVNYVLSVQHLENGTMEMPRIQTAATEKKKPAKK